MEAKGEENKEIRGKDKLKEEGERFSIPSLSSKTLISSIDSWLLRSLAVKCSLSTHTDTHSLFFLHTHKHTPGYMVG